jgi:hypothetical protein
MHPAGKTSRRRRQFGYCRLQLPVAIGRALIGDLIAATRYAIHAAGLALTHGTRLPA